MSDPEFRAPEVPAERPSRPKAPRRLLLGLATALAVATGAGVATAAALPDHQVQPSPDTSETTMPGEPGAPTPPGQGQAGGYQTFTSQTGTVTAVQGGSISVSGDNGAARTYTVDESTRLVAGVRGLAGVQTGDTVWVVGTPGDQPRALMLVDVTRPEWPGHGMGGAQQPGRQPTETPPSAPGEVPPTTGETGPGEPSAPETVAPTG
ncbi:hypothetical protein [Microbispora sp. NPDC049125]|uniref:hypothetical protein n=1 Tax=Microbispora sp. NPDC049125 TaxID=3154929 RepID=UPI00346628B7